MVRSARQSRATIDVYRYIFRLSQCSCHSELLEETSIMRVLLVIIAALLLRQHPFLVIAQANSPLDLVFLVDGAAEYVETLFRCFLSPLIVG
jgi:hypothetical protein